MFVADVTPPPLKSHARIMRFLQASGIDPASLPISNGTSVERNKKFSKCVQECVVGICIFVFGVMYHKKMFYHESNYIFLTINLTFFSM